MKKNLILIMALVTSMPALAGSASLKGFAGLNLLSQKSVSNEDSTMRTGFDRFNITVAGKRENFSAKIKLNLDLSRDDISRDTFHLFDEVNVTYNHNGDDNLFVTVGKGQLAFNTLHWGALKPYYVDGGSMYTHSTFRSTHFRNDSTVLLTSLKYVNEDLGIENELAAFGTEYGQVGNSYEKQKSTKTYDLNEQRGFANKFSYTYDETHKVVVGAKWYKHDLWHRSNAAGNISYNYEGDSLNLWAGYLYGVYGGHEAAGELLSDTYPSAVAYEQIAQLGAEYELNELVNIIANFEAYFTKDREFDRSSKGYWLDELDTVELDKTSYRMELVAKFKLTKVAFINAGIMHERNEMKFNGTPDSDKNRYTGFTNGSTMKSNATLAAATLSYWF